MVEGSTQRQHSFHLSGLRYGKSLVAGLRFINACRTLEGPVEVGINDLNGSLFVLSVSGGIPRRKLAWITKSPQEALRILQTCQDL